MGYRLFDMECSACGNVSEELIDCVRGEGAPDTVLLDCPDCDEVTAYRRCAVTLTAPYMGEKVHNPQVSGGAFDTMGKAAPPEIPDMPGEAAHGAETSRRLAALGADASGAARMEVFRDQARTAPSIDDYKAHNSKPEIREIKAKRERVKASNRSKQARAAALARGEKINFRNDKCVGDPRIG